MTVNATTTINAIGYKAGMTDSTVASATYTIPVTVTVAPLTATLFGGQTQTFTATVANTGNTAVTWSSAPTGVGSIDPITGVYTAPAMIANQQTVTVTATSQADNTKTGTATITLKPTITVSVGPATASLYPLQTQQFTATITGSTNTSVTWSTGVGTINAAGLYTAPPAVSTQQVVTVTATSSADNTTVGTASVTLNPALGTGPTPARPACSTVDLASPLTPSLAGLFLVNESTGATDLNIVDYQSASFAGTSLPAWIASDPSVAFNGAAGSSYLNAGTDIMFDRIPVSQVTILAKVYVTAVTGTAVAGKNDGNCCDSGFVFGWDGTGSLRLTMERSGSDMRVGTATGTITAGRWMQVAFTWDGTAPSAAAAHLFIDGVEQTKAFGNDGGGTWGYANATNQPFLIGLATFDLGGSLNGRIAYLAVYKGRILTPAEMNQLDLQLPAVGGTCGTGVPAVTLSATPSTVRAPGTSALVANQAVTWSLSGPGTLSTAGPSVNAVYTVPPSLAAPQTATIVATSQADPSKTASVALSLLPPAILQLTTQTDAPTYLPGKTVALTVTAQNPFGANAASTQMSVTNPNSSVVTFPSFAVPVEQSHVEHSTYTVPTIAPPPVPTLPPSTGSTLFGVNLIVNGDAEAALGADSDNIAASVPAWTRTSNFTTLTYDGAGGNIRSTDPGPANRGSNFFAGGPNSALSSATQNIDVSSAAASVDGGAVTYQFSAYLGGWSFQYDNAVITADFKNANGTTISTAALGPVTRDDRGSQTGLFPRSTSGTLPAGTRTVTITMTMYRIDGAYNDGYADNLSLVLAGPPGTGTNDLTTRTYLTTLAATDNSALTFTAQATWSDGAGGNFGPVSGPGQATEILPVVNAALNGTAAANSGSAISYSATVTNTGHATASGLTASITLPDGTVQSLSLSATTLAPQASAQATATFPIPPGQPTGDLFARAAVSWVDAQSNPYGPVLSTVRTSVTGLATLLQNATLTVTPAAPGPYIAGTTQSFTATLKNQGGSPIPGIALAFNSTGSNSATASATTSAAGTATFTYNGSNAGADSVQASINLGASLFTSNGLPVYWVTPLKTSV